MQEGAPTKGTAVERGRVPACSGCHSASFLNSDAVGDCSSHTSQEEESSAQETAGSCTAGGAIDAPHLPPTRGPLDLQGPAPAGALLVLLVLCLALLAALAAAAALLEQVVVVPVLGDRGGDPALLGQARVGKGPLRQLDVRIAPLGSRGLLHPRQLPCRQPIAVRRVELLPFLCSRAHHLACVGARSFCQGE